MCPFLLGVPESQHCLVARVAGVGEAEQLFVEVLNLRFHRLHSDTERDGIPLRVLFNGVYAQAFVVERNGVPALRSPLHVVSVESLVVLSHLGPHEVILFLLKELRIQMLAKRNGLISSLLDHTRHRKSLNLGPLVGLGLDLQDDFVADRNPIALVDHGVRGCALPIWDEFWAVRSGTLGQRRVPPSSTLMWDEPEPAQGVSEGRFWVRGILRLLFPGLEIS